MKSVIKVVGVEDGGSFMYVRFKNEGNMPAVIDLHEVAATGVESGSDYAHTSIWIGDSSPCNPGDEAVLKIAVLPYSSDDSAIEVYGFISYANQVSEFRILHQLDRS